MKKEQLIFDFAQRELPTFLPGDLVEHIGTGERFRITTNQKAIPGIEWLVCDDIVYGVSVDWPGRVALMAWQLRVIVER